MFPISDGSAMNVLVSNHATLDLSAGVVGTLIKKATDLADGQLVLLNEYNKVVAPASLASITTPHKFAVRTGDKLVYSDFINPTDTIVRTNVTLDAPDTMQVTYVGYNGTTSYGALPTAAGEYILNVEILDEDVATSVYPYIKHATYYSASTFTQEAIAFGLIESAIQNFARESQSKIYFDAVCDEAMAATGDGNDAVTGTAGTKTLTFTGDTATDLVVGDYVRLGTGVTDPVYKIVSGSVTDHVGSVVVDRLLVSDVDATGAQVEYLASATGLAADWGIKMTGVAQTQYVPGVRKHFVTRFKVTLPWGFTTTDVTYNTSASLGHGTYQEVAELEYLAQGFDGKKVYVGVPPFVSRSAASSALTYDRFTISYTSPGYSNLISNNPANVKTLVIYINAANTDLNAELDTCIG